MTRIGIQEAVLIGFEVLAEIATDTSISAEDRVYAASALIDWKPPTIGGDAWVPEQKVENDTAS